MLDFRMETFLAVCRHMNFTKAADSLHITQPAVSQHIHHIEKDYGILLFQYEGKKMLLTPEGHMLLQAVSALKHDDLFIREQFKNPPQNFQNLTFGATLTTGECAAADMLADHLAVHPDTHARLIIANTKELLQKLDDDEIDFALIEGSFPKNNYDYMLYSSERFIAVEKYSLGTNSVLSLEEVVHKPLLIRETGSGCREILENFLQLNNYSLADFDHHIEINNIHALKKLTLRGLGITFLYEAAVIEEIKNASLYEVKIQNFQITHDFTFVWKKGNIFSKNCLKFLRKFGYK